MRTLAQLVVFVISAFSLSAATNFVVPGTYASAEADGSSTTSGLFGTAAVTVQIQITAAELAVLGLNPGDQIIGVRTRLDRAQPAGPAADTTVTSLDITLAQAAFSAGSITQAFTNNMKSPVVVRSGSFKIPANSMPGGATPNAFGVLVPFTTSYTYTGGDLVFMYTKTAVSATLIADSANTYTGVGTAYRTVLVGGYQAATGNNTGTGLPIIEFEIMPRFGSKNSASYAPTTLTADMIAYGEATGIAIGTTIAPDGPWPISLGGAHLEVLDSQGQARPASLYYVTDNAMAYLVPAGTALGQATTKLTTSTGVSVTGTIIIAAVAPGLYSANSSGSGVAAGLFLRYSADGSQSWGYLFDLPNRNPLPIDLGPETDKVYLQLYGTGFRAGKQATATVGGVSVPVAGFAATGYQGEDALNIGPLPRSLANRGVVDVVVAVDNKVANAVTASFK